MNSLTTFGFILCSCTVTLKITHLVWFSTQVFGRSRDIIYPGVIHCSRRESETADLSCHKEYLLLFCRCGIVFLKRRLKGIPDDKRHSGDNTMLSTAIPPYVKSLMAATIRIYNDKRFDTGREKE